MNARPQPSAFFRTLFDAVAGRNAPIAPGADPDGRSLAEVGERCCRFPVAHPVEGVRFCAEPVSLDDWRRGSVNGSYCRFHRDWLLRQPRAGLDERSVAP